MAAIHPMVIRGAWADGYVLDYHTVSSTYVGDNEYGHPVFATQRTPLGELLFRLKSRSDQSVVGEIVDAVEAYIRLTWRPRLTMIVPVPPSNTARRLQPVLVLADALGRQLRLDVRHDAVTKIRNTPQLKNVYDYAERAKVLEGVLRADSSLVAGQSILLFDDLYRSGATMNAVAMALSADGQAAAVHALALTRTRRRR